MLLDLQAGPGTDESIINLSAADQTLGVAFDVKSGQLEDRKV